jgi:hypothetical protein
MAGLGLAMGTQNKHFYFAGNQDISTLLRHRYEHCFPTSLPRCRILETVQGKTTGGQP